MECPRCGYKNLPGLKKCEKCGLHFPSNIKKYYEMSRKRLGEIEELETNLRRERALLLKERRWYQKPANWIGIIAIFVSLLLYMVNLISFKEKKELTISHSPLTPLITFESPVLSKLNINFESKPIENLWRFLVRIQNSGNKSITKEDFIDSPIQIKLAVSSLPSGYSVDESTLFPLLLDVIEKSVAGQTKQILKVLYRGNPASFIYLPSLLNKEEAVELEVYLSACKDFEFFADGKIADGKLINIGQIQDSIMQPRPLSPLKMVITGFHRLFWSKWMAALIFLLAALGLGFITTSYWMEVEAIELAEEYITIILAIFFIVVFLSMFILLLIL